MKILVAWDQPDQFDLVQLYLGLGDHDLHCANTPDELLELAARQAWQM